MDHDDPNYTDRCLEITGELCDYCCLIDFEWCSRDIYNCEPIRDRSLTQMMDCGITLGSIIIGFPVLGFILYYCMLVRTCYRCYPHLGGISCFECCCRISLLLFCCRNFTQTYPASEDDDGELVSARDSEGMGCCKRFSCCCCLCCCKGKSKAKSKNIEMVEEDEE